MGYFLLSLCTWPTLSKSATTTALDVSEVLLLVFGAVLTTGVLGEYKKFPRLLRASVATFELMVVIGIAGELLADGAIFVFSRHLQTLSEGEYATLNSEASGARREANTALLEQEKLKAENLKLEALIQPRSLTLEEQKAIGLALPPFTGQKIKVWSLMSDPETYALGEQIVAAFKCGDMNVEDDNGKLFPGTGSSSITGLQVRYWLTQGSARNLAKVLKKIGHLENVRLLEETQGTAPMLDVWVMAKPLPLLKAANLCNSCDQPHKAKK
jgi:hypothetical protein